MSRENNWISVTEKLPKNFQNVIIHFEGKVARTKGNIVEGWYNGKHWDSYANTSLKTINAINWMPLPEPPTL